MKFLATSSIIFASAIALAVSGTPSPKDESHVEHTAAAEAAVHNNAGNPKLESIAENEHSGSQPKIMTAQPQSHHGAATAAAEEGDAPKAMFADGGLLGGAGGHLYGNGPLGYGGLSGLIHGYGAAGLGGYGGIQGGYFPGLVGFGGYPFYGNPLYNHYLMSNGGGFGKFGGGLGYGGYGLY
ncbi:hypothetical protein H4219_003574 [Mycoemilia scoparia]|uniref:Uncharacterized protein n=1 Tax=Mycoemilia scoparia TaxID=417184 RepID=A0A9W8DSG1_9FUNG|nr:hypothetical protein H4219_003574 [Mycoemilia scoparia]